MTFAMINPEHRHYYSKIRGTSIWRCLCGRQHDVGAR